MRPLDVRLAARSTALLYAAGAALLVVAAFLEDASSRGEILALAGLAAAVSVTFALLDRTRRATLWLAFAADLLAIWIVAALVAASDGAQSLYPAYYLLPVLHAAVFQDRLRTAVVGVLSVAAFLAPLAYEAGDAGEFAPLAVAVLVPAIAFAVVTQVVVGALRAERRALEGREAEALRIAESDELTGIGNYRRFWRALQSEAARARRHEQPFSLIVLDLDGFKAINDQLGHQAGDETLRRVARALEREVREEDVLCRQGGDEFGVIAVAAGEPETRELARRLVDAVAAAGGYGLDEPLSASAGWATFGAPERSAEGLLALADRALREAKGRRRRAAAPPAGAAERRAAETSGWPPPRGAEPEAEPPERLPGPRWPAAWPARRGEPGGRAERRREEHPPAAEGPSPREWAPRAAGNGEPQARGGPWASPPVAGAAGRRRPHDPRLAALAEFSRALALAEDEDAVVQLAVAHVADALEAAAVELWRRDARSGRARLVARGRHRHAPRIHEAEVVSPEEVVRVMATNHVAGNGDGRLLVPVSHEGVVDGVVAILTGRPGGTPLEHRHLAVAMATQLGRALAAASLRATLERADPAELARLGATVGVEPAAEEVAEVAVAAGRALGLSPEELETLRHAALLHRVGMLGVPAGLPLRPAPLSDEEIGVVREHPLIAERLLRPIPRLAAVARTLRHANERHDGAGYPDGLTGQEIPLTSRILHAAVAYCSMRAHRPWRAALADHEARNELRDAAGAQLDPEVVEALLRALESRAATG